MASCHTKTLDSMTWEVPSYPTVFVQYLTTALKIKIKVAMISYILLAQMHCAIRVKVSFLRASRSLASTVDGIMNFPKIYNLNQFS